MSLFKRKSKVDRLAELENENRALKNQVEYLVRTIRETDDKIFTMSQQLSWEGMRPAFNELKDQITARKVIENRRISNLVRGEIIQTYQPLQIERK